MVTVMKIHSLLKKYLKYFVVFLLVPLTLVLGFVLIPDKFASFCALVCVLLSALPFFLAFENKKTTARTTVIIAVMTAISVAGRFVFAPVPFFKPVSAFIIITAVYFGAEAGFLTGAFTAVISNFYFGQGPWTPFQMFAWGMVGFLAGILSKPILNSRVVLAVYSLFSGVIYSLIMDVWTTLWMDGYFNPARFLAEIISAAPVTAVYSVSNLIFIFILLKPIGKKLERLKTKYGLS